MVRRKDARIYVLCHKQVDYIKDNELYEPIEVGADMRDVHCCALKDNTGDNISRWNPVYAELTGQYWIWKNRPKELDIVGQCQYRRVLDFPEIWDYTEIFRDYDIVACKPLYFNISNYLQYAHCHSLIYIAQIKSILVEHYPEYVESFDKYIVKSNKLYYSNSYIMHSDTYDKYCIFLFDILDKFLEMNNLKSVEDCFALVRYNIDNGLQSNAGADRDYFYQAQLCGFLAERLYTLWVRHNYEGRIYEVEYELKENTSI